MQVGNKVLCIHKFISKEWFSELKNVTFPIKGCIYTIRSINIDGGIVFNEIINETFDGFTGEEEFHFNPERFILVSPDINELSDVIVNEFGKLIVYE